MAFEPPNCCVDAKLGDVLRANRVTMFSTWTGNDIVPGVPFPIPGRDWQKPDLAVHRIGTAAFPWPNVTDHAIDNVIAAVRTSQEITA